MSPEIYEHIVTQGIDRGKLPDAIQRELRDAMALKRRRKPATTRSLETQLLRRYLGKLGPVGRVLGKGSIPSILITGAVEVLTRTIPDSLRVIGEAYGSRYLGGKPSWERERAARASQLERITVSAQRLPVPSPQPRAGSRVATAPRPGAAAPVLAEVRAPQIARRAPVSRIATAAMGPPTPQPKAPTPSRAQRIAQRAQTAARQMSTISPLLDLLQRRGSSRTAESSRIVQLETLPNANVTPAPGSQPMPGSGYFFGPPSRGAQRQCECKSKSKKARRRCKERAQVVWKTGRKKGKSAGSRCVVYYT